MKIVEILSVADGLPGMRLAEAVTDQAGNILMQGGVELSESMLASLRRRDIAQIAIERDVDEDPAKREARLAELRQTLDRRFRKTGESPEAGLLYQAILDFELNKRR